jgi:hypothetical protein
LPSWTATFVFDVRLASTVWTPTLIRVDVEEVDRVLSSVTGEVSVMAVDHCQARAHVPGKVEGRDPGTERERREGVAEIVDPAPWVDSGRFLGRLPVAVAEVIQIEVAAVGCREDEIAMVSR